MSNLNPNDVSSGNPPSVPSPNIAPGEPPPKPEEKKPYEKYDDPIDTSMPSLARTGNAEGEGMQSLAQSARGSQLKNAKWTLIVVGIITIAANAYFVFSNRSNVENLLRQRGIHHMPAEVESALQLDSMIGFGFMGAGAAFIVLGLAVTTKPVLCTSLGLALYIGGIAIAAAVNPMSLMQGIIFKVAIIAGLFQAVKAAMAYESETRESGDSAASPVS